MTAVTDPSTVTELHQRALVAFGQRVETIGAEQWHLPTPCPEWDVRALVAHVVEENRWAAPLFAGQTIAEVGDRLSGDLLGVDPVRAWRASATEATEAVTGDGVMESIVHLSFGDLPGREYAMQLVADLLIHGWDLAHATGGDESLDPVVAAACARWFDANEAAYRAAGVIGPAAELAEPVDAVDEPTRLLARFGRDPSPDTPLSVLRRFNEAFARADVDAVMSLMTDDCVFEDTTPPDGGRFVGQAAVRAAWERFFADTPDPHFTLEAASVDGQRVTFRWRYDWADGHVRGVDLVTIRDGKVAEKLSYVKG